MGFKSVHRILVEIFPLVDARLLRAVAIEHPKDADAAAEVVLTEILPYMSYSAYMDFAASADKSCSDAKDGEDVSSGSSSTKNNMEHLTNHQSTEASLMSSSGTFCGEDMQDKEFDDLDAGDSCAVPHDKDHHNGDLSSNSNLQASESAVGLQDLKHVDGCSELPVGEKSTFEPNQDSIVTRSGQVCRIDVLEESIEDARSHKKTMFSAMESVLSMMREVEICEKAASEAKVDAARGGVDIFDKVEELKQMVAQAKEANDMHGGEVFGEKAVLATEVKELQSRLLSLSDERDKSLAMLDEMRQTLETRMAAADELRKSAEQEKMEKEESARIALAEQEAMLETAIKERKLLQQQAEENSRLRDFLVDRGHLVDTLQGEISVICQDVKFLKEKFDEGFPLSEHLSSSQTTYRLASSGSFSRSKGSDAVAERDDMKLQKSWASSVDDDQSAGSLQVNLSTQGSVSAADRNMLADAGWEVCEGDDAF